MGLDMSLRGERFYSGWDNDGGRAKDVCGAEISGQTVELGYWRKHPTLHGFIVGNFAGGNDECQRIDLGEEALESIMDAVRKNTLPHTEGFFFGDPKEPDYMDTLKQLQGALDWLKVKEKGCWKSVYYEASW